jgi:hypothetical protein
MDNRLNNKEHLNHITNHVCSYRCVSWTAIFMGALVAIAFSFILNLLCLGIGISAFPTTSDGQLVFAISGFIGLVICAILAMFPAGYVAGKLGRIYCLKRKAGELHGLGAWTIALIISILLGASVGNFVNQSTYIITRKPVDIRLTNLNNDKVYTVKQNNENAPPIKVEIDPDKAADATAMATFATFFIFFVGLLAACFGGRCAMMCKKEELEKSHYHCEQCNKI